MFGEVVLGISFNNMPELVCKVSIHNVEDVPRSGRPIEAAIKMQ